LYTLPEKTELFSKIFLKILFFENFTGAFLRKHIEVCVSSQKRGIGIFIHSHYKTLLVKSPNDLAVEKRVFWKGLQKRGGWPLMVFTKASVRPCCLLPFPGMRISDVVFSRLNETSQEMEVRRQNEHILSKEYFFDDSRCFLTKITWRYFSIHGSLVEMSASAGVWQGDHGPPVDTPPCGFQNERCYKTSAYLFVAKITFFWKIVDFVPKN
jgi:hypothetical protein